MGHAAGRAQGLDGPRVRQGVAYQFGPTGVEPLLGGRRAVVFTTSNTPRDDELRLFGDPLENLWKACVFNFCGVEDFYRRNFEPVIMSTPEDRRQWLADVRSIVRQRFSLRTEIVPSSDPSGLKSALRLATWRISAASRFRVVLSWRWAWRLDQPRNSSLRCFFLAASSSRRASSLASPESTIF